MSTAVSETELTVITKLEVTAPGVFNTSNLSGASVIAPAAGTTTFFYDTDEDLLGYRNTITGGVVNIAPYERFGYFNNVNPAAVINSTTDVEVTWNSLAISVGSVVNLNGGRITLDTLGLYKLVVDICYTGTGTSRSVFRSRLSADDGGGAVILPFSEVHTYSRNSTGNGRESATINTFYDNLIIGTQVIINAARFGGNITGSPTVNAYRATVTKVNV